MKAYHSTIPSALASRLTRDVVVSLLFITLIFPVRTSYGQAGKSVQSNFYSITGNSLKDTSWLFGTYHLVKSSYLDEVAAVKKAFDVSKGVIVELVVDSSKIHQAARLGLLTNTTLSKLLAKPFQDSLDNELKNTLGIGIEQLDRLKPMNVAITLSMVYLVTDRNSPLQRYTGQMLDGYFAETGKVAGKHITALETMEEQMALLFNSSSDQEQVKMLEKFLRNKPEMISQGNVLIDYWFKHDLNSMDSVSKKGFKVFGDEEQFLTRRNNRWMETIPDLVRRESQFIAVGALHLAGPEGLVNQLERLGFTLTPIKL